MRRSSGVYSPQRWVRYLVHRLKFIVTAVPLRLFPPRPHEMSGPPSFSHRFQSLVFRYTKHNSTMWVESKQGKLIRRSNPPNTVVRWRINTTDQVYERGGIVVIQIAYMWRSRWECKRSFRETFVRVLRVAVLPQLNRPFIPLRPHERGRCESA